jgi:HD-GYP domain-containing protein (c-di-GMP phosphodiesterase class II)
VILSPARGDRAVDSPVRRTHVVLGEQAVRRVPEIAAVAGAIRHHHERFDGAGYPDGLVGIAAPIESRVVACAEEVVALVPDAPDGRARRQGITRLRERAGGMLDPTVVEVAVAVVTTTGEPAGRSMPRAA